MSTKSDDISLSGVLSEAKRIVKANKKNFLILSLLFLLPLYILLFIYITIFPIWPQSDSTFTATPTITFLQILYTIVCCVFYISATGTITYSAFHGYYNRPLELIPTLKSLSSSFFPLGSTLLVSQLISSSIGILIGIVVGIMYFWLGSFTWTVIVVVIMFCVSITYLQVKWIMSNVVAVVELKWGYEPFRRSAYLMKGMRSIALKMIAYFVNLSFLCMYPYYRIPFKPDRDGFWLWISMIVAVSCWMTVLMEYSLTATVVLYISSMKIHGELEIQPEEYVSLIVDDDGNKSLAVVHA